MIRIEFTIKLRELLLGSQYINSCCFGVFYIPDSIGRDDSQTPASCSYYCKFNVHQIRAQSTVRRHTRYITYMHFMSTNDVVNYRTISISALEENKTENLFSVKFAGER